MKLPYLDLQWLPPVDKSQYEEAVSAIYQTVGPPEEMSQARVSPVRGVNDRSRSSFQQSKLCQDLTETFGPGTKSLFFRFSSGYIYDWHTDSGRKAAINIVLNEVPSTLMWKYHERGKLYKFVKCPYRVLHPVLINTQIDHMVIVDGDRDRYLLTVGLPASVTFDDACEWIKNYRIDSYF